MILTAAAGAAQAMQQQKAAQAQADYTTKSNALAAQSADEQMAQRQNDGQRQATQVYEQQSSEVNQYQLNAQRESATLDALLGEYGASGTSADRRLATLGVRQGQDTATLQSNAQKTSDELTLATRSDLVSMGNQKASSQRAVVKPSNAALALTIGGVALQGASRLNTINNPSPGSGTK